MVRLRNLPQSHDISTSVPIRAIPFCSTVLSEEFMSRLLFLFFLLAFGTTASAENRCGASSAAPMWQGGGAVVVTKHPALTQVVFTSRVDSPEARKTVENCPMEQWNDIDMSSLVPEGAMAVFVQGLLIITHGTTQEICDLVISFRLPGDDTGDPSGNYIGQVVEANLGGGQRSPFASWVPISSTRHLEFWWKTTPTTSGYWPCVTSNAGPHGDA